MSDTLKQAHAALRWVYEHGMIKGRPQWVSDAFSDAFEEARTPPTQVGRDWTAEPLTPGEHVAADIRAKRFPMKSTDEEAMQQIDAERTVQVGDELVEPLKWTEDQFSAGNRYTADNGWRVERGYDERTNYYTVFDSSGIDKGSFRRFDAALLFADRQRAAITAAQQEDGL